MDRDPELEENNEKEEVDCPPPSMLVADRGSMFPESPSVLRRPEEDVDIAAPLVGRRLSEEETSAAGRDDELRR